MTPPPPPPLADAIANAVLSAYAQLPKTGKPVARAAKHEWTVLAGIVAVTSTQIECIALGTGLKCLNPSQMPADGSCLHDSHAEVICRRSFMHYLYASLEAEESGQAIKGKGPRILVPQEKDGEANRLYRVADGVSLHFYISQSPCGDASMSALSMEQTSAELNIVNKKRKFTPPPPTAASSTTTSATATADSPFDLDDPITAQQALRGRHDYSALGRLRTKPARTDAETTRSMSCSDKLAKWCLLGLQGALLMQWIPTPIRIATLVVGPERCDEQSIRRAVVDRAKSVVAKEELNDIRVETTDLQFEFSVGALTQKLGGNPSAKRAKAGCEEAATTTTTTTTTIPLHPNAVVLIPANAALAWDATRGPRGPAEVTVSGRKQGAAKMGGEWSLKARSSLCRASFYARFLALSSSSKEQSVSQQPPATYRAAKLASTKYQAARAAMLADPNFAGWVFGGDELQEFTVAPVVPRKGNARSLLSD
ncbi:adenosine deaminase/editase [Geranomyces variabilis]|nr:adenosine deaminase/editase [Geranomyces variabilis]KAJ3132310.1 tRNA-specific adenosine deaminase 1 [Geranomyces variabilis]